MFRSALSVVPFVALTALISIACGDDTSTAPDAPTPVSITQTFPAEGPGTLTPNGGITHFFAVQQAGRITATLTSLAPDSATIVGLSLGSWNGASCAQTISRDEATQGSGIVGDATSTGNYCVRIYDARGSLTQPVQYQITVTHF